MTNHETEYRLDHLYRSILTAQRSKERGGHYRCMYEQASYMVLILLGEVPAPTPVHLKIKTEHGWVSGIERKGKPRSSRG
jgi:hypothetical protein